jgi:hypothetical protein
MEQNSKRHRVSTRLARQAFRITGNSQADHGHHDDRGRHRLGQGIEQAGEKQQRQQDKQRRCNRSQTGLGAARFNAEREKEPLTGIEWLKDAVILSGQQADHDWRASPLGRRC